MRSPVAGLVVIVWSVGCSQVATPTRPSLVAGSAEHLLESETATVAASATSTVPFKGTLEGIADPPQFEPPPSTSFTAHLLASGNATHLGRFTMDYTHRVTGLNGIGAATFTAANGDTLTTTAEGTATPASSPTAFTVVEIHTITGGTGRFSAASGSFILTRSVDFADPFTAGSFEGSLTKP